MFFFKEATLGFFSLKSLKASPTPQRSSKNKMTRAASVVARPSEEELDLVIENMNNGDMPS